MKAIIVSLLVFSLSACGTIGGALTGAGRDMQQLGGWVLSK